MKPFKVLSLFTGCGGLDLGFELSKRFEIVAVNDNWNVALDTFEENRKKSNAEIIGGDIRDKDVRNKILAVAKKHNVEIVIGGPPCQDFSSAGSRNGNGYHGNLTPLFAQIVSEIKPRWVVMENVNTIRSIGEKQLAECKNILKKSNYGLTIQVLNAIDFEVPQNRKRLFIIGRLDGNDDEMLPFIDSLKKNHKSVKEHLPEITQGENATNYYYRHPRSYSRRAIFSVEEPSPTIRGVNRPIPKNYRFHKSDATKDISKVRPLTTFERAAIQTFPKDYQWIGSKTEIEQQIGNAVPPRMALHIANAILKFENRGLKPYLGD